MAPRKKRNCEETPRVKSKMADDAHIFNIWTPISVKRLKLETSSLLCASTTRCNLDGMQKLGQIRRPCLRDLSFQVRTPVNG